MGDLAVSLPPRPGEVFRAFLKLGLVSFGGPTAHLGYFRSEFVKHRKWISDGQYGQLVGLCQFLPGPASSQVACALGFLRGGAWGALFAWVAFTLPSAFLLILFAIGAVSLDGPAGLGLLMGLKAAAAAVVAHAVWAMARTLTPDVKRGLIGIAACVLALMVPGNWGQLSAICMGVLAGLAVCRATAADVSAPLHFAVSKSFGVMCAAVYFALLAALPILAATVHNSWISTGNAFYRAGALVFGGGHVVLPLLQADPTIADSVGNDQFLAGYAAAQAVPGPMFTFAAYVGFAMDTGGLAWVTAAVALLAVFLPGMLLLAAALPFFSMLQNSPKVRAAIAGANAAVVGILAAAFITPISTSAITAPTPLIIAAACLALLVSTRIPNWAVVSAGAAGGTAMMLINAWLL